MVFDSSYVGFLGLDESQSRGSGSGLGGMGGKQSGGGGRITFGGFGDVPVSAREAEGEMDDDDDANDGGSADRSEVYEDTPRRRKIGAVIRKDGDDVKNVLVCLLSSHSHSLPVGPC